MTKTDLLAGPVRWHDVADLDLAVGDDHPVDQELDQRPVSDRRSPGPDPAAPAGRTSSMAPESPASSLCRSACASSCLACSSSWRWRSFEITPAPPVLVQQDHPAEIGLGQPLELLPEARLSPSKSLLACLEFLRQPLPTMRPCQARARPARDGSAGRRDRPRPARPGARPGSVATGTSAPDARTRPAACRCRSSSSCPWMVVRARQARPHSPQLTRPRSR